jgi:molybdopterin converting factor subunit 1
MSRFPGTINVQVLFFAAHREALGVSRADIELMDGATVRDLYRRLEEQHPQLGNLREYTSYAVNREMVDSSMVLHAGDEVALLQPVSGGAG